MLRSKIVKIEFLKVFFYTVKSLLLSSNSQLTILVVDQL